MRILGWSLTLAAVAAILVAAVGGAVANGGSRTAVLGNDAGKLGQAINAVDIGQKVVRGDVVGLAAKLAAHLKARGISDADATALAQASVDPAQLDGVIASIRGTYCAK